MILKIGGAAEPCPPCKIILNGGFMAVLAPVLAGLYVSGSAISDAAARLALAASTYIKMLAVVGIAVHVNGDWEGCGQARLLICWISGREDADCVQQMDDWTAELWFAITDLATGKLPTG